MNLALAVIYLFPTADPFRDFRVEDDGNGQAIVSWNLEAPQPTEQELEAAWAQVQAKQAAADAEWNARLALADMYHQLPVEIRDRYKSAYNAINQAFQRGDSELAAFIFANMTVHPGDEEIYAMFQSAFPSTQ